MVTHERMHCIRRFYRGGVNGDADPFKWTYAPNWSSKGASPLTMQGRASELF